jgi:hypothetical protein
MTNLAVQHSLMGLRIHLRAKRCEHLRHISKSRKSVLCTAHWNKTLVTANTCVCGCSELEYAEGCDSSVPALPGAAATINFGGVTDRKIAQYPNQMVCADGCASNIHLDLYQNFKGVRNLGLRVCILGVIRLGVGQTNV